jgi:hypothetical protein
VSWVTEVITVKAQISIELDEELLSAKEAEASFDM